MSEVTSVGQEREVVVTILGLFQDWSDTEEAYHWLREPMRLLISVVRAVVGEVRWSWEPIPLPDMPSRTFEVVYRPVENVVKVMCEDDDEITVQEEGKLAKRLRLYFRDDKGRADTTLKVIFGHGAQGSVS